LRLEQPLNDDHHDPRSGPRSSARHRPAEPSTASAVPLLWSSARRPISAGGRFLLDLPPLFGDSRARCAHI